MFIKKWMRYVLMDQAGDGGGEGAAAPAPAGTCTLKVGRITVIKE